MIRLLPSSYRYSHSQRLTSVIPEVRYSHPCFFSSETSSPDQVEVQRTKQRRRRRVTTSITENVPSYKEFVHRHSVISLYRNYLKEIRLMPYNQMDLREQVKREFKSNKTIADPFNVQRALTEGKRRLGELQQFTGSNNKYEGDSWLNTQDDEDPRGRVGTGWPWERNNN